ncbi:hypothetical protein KIW84_034862 [Lathyrus oleraceus]|uniref:Uncharacterized protein n=1 Tax=Pisum sativum TaxID=3888 RepID=A0A9D4Y4J0_PEA|nr:hypothetical protein KIW84_034862 [Pisum sativum]
MITVDEDRVDATPDLKNAPVGVDCLPDSDLSDSRVEPGAGVPTSELQASHSDANGGTTISNSEATLDQKFYVEVNSEEIPNDGGVVVFETQHNNDVAFPKTQHSNGMVIFETQQSNEVVMPEEQTINDVVMTEAMTENELAISTIDSNHHLSHPEETHSHNHHFADFHMIPEDQLPQPESLPNCDPPPYSIHHLNEQLI